MPKGIRGLIHMKHIYRVISPALLVLMLVILLVQPLYAAEPGEEKHVLILFSEDKSHPAHEMTERGIREVFRSDKLFKVQLFTEYLDVSRFGGISHARTMADYLRRKYSGKEIHAIIAVYPAAVEFLLAERRELFPEVPIIASEMTNKGYAEKLERSVARRFLTGTIIEADITDLIDAALRMRPKTKYVALVAGTAPNDIFGDTAFRTAIRPYSGRIDLIDLTKLSMEETLSRVGSLPPDTIVLYETIFMDGDGKIFVPREALSLISRASKVPVFGLYESYLGFGIVGGRLASLEKHGKEAAAMALRIMGGESPAAIPFGGDQAYVSAYDWRELKRWNIPEPALLAGAEILYRTPSLWEKYKLAIIGTVSLIIVETCLILWLLITILRRREAERSLRASEERYRMLFESAPEGIILIGADGHVLKANSLQASLYGYESPWELEGMSALLFVAEKDRDLAAQNMRALLQGNELPDRIYTAVRRDGSEFFVEVTSVIIRGSRREVQGYLCLTRDISKSKEDENERIQLRNELTHLSRVMTMNELSTSLAHEINQPLGAILNNAEAAQLLISRMKDAHDDISEILADIIQDTKRAGDVIRKIRGIVKKSEAFFEPLSMNDLIEDVARLFHNYNRMHDVSLLLELQPDLAQVRGDRVHLQQVLVNIMTNAVEAIRGCPSKTLTIRSCMTVRDMLTVSVTDSGTGIVAEQKDRLFEAFYTTKKDGLGMGLRICRSIIEEHGGRIWAENSPAGGATFSFSLEAWRGEPS